jgi:DNA-binding beta-propeller fold protein YncE
VTTVPPAAGCTTATAPAPQLTGVRTAMESVADAGSPYGVVVTSGGGWSFVSEANSVGVYRIDGAALPSYAQPVATAGRPLGEALTPDGRYLLAADGGGAVVISVSRAESGEPAVLGTLGSSGRGAIEVAVSPGGRFAFVSEENSASIAVFDLQQALTRGFSAADLVGVIPVGIAPVGMAVSPGGRWLYATSETAAQAGAAALPESQGTLTVISMARAETDPAASVVSTVYAGCSPVRVVTSQDGSIVWVTARGSDQVLGFAAARLRSDPAHSLIASVEVGEAPVGMALVDDGRRIVVADSNRSAVAGAAASLAVVDVAAALDGKPALLGYLAAGGFPREMALEPGGSTLLVTNFSSQQVETVSVADLPAGGPPGLSATSSTALPWLARRATLPGWRS